MQREIKFDHVKDLIAELLSEGITRVAFSVANERRPRQLNEKELSLNVTVILEILAYKNPTIYKCVLVDIDVDKIRDVFESQGFEVTRRNRNII